MNRKEPHFPCYVSLKVVLENYSPLFKDRFPISLTNIWLILGVNDVWVSIHFGHKVTRCKD